MAEQKISQLNPIAAGSIDRANDVLEISDISLGQSFKVTPNALFNISGSVVGTTDTQTLTNKTITAPAISAPVISGTITGTYTLGGTPTFPSSVATLTGSQTLTNKTLTSPTINTPTISNASITANAISGFTTSNSGTIYGVSIVLGIIQSAALVNQVNTAAIQNGAVTSTKLGISSGFSGGVASQTNTGTAGGTMYYINLGGIKLLWGISAAVNVTSAAPNFTIIFPSGFFTTIQTGNVTGNNLNSDSRQNFNFTSVTATTATVLTYSPATSNNENINYFFLGT